MTDEQVLSALLNDFATLDKGTTSERSLAECSIQQFLDDHSFCGDSTELLPFLSVPSFRVCFFPYVMRKVRSKVLSASVNKVLNSFYHSRSRCFVLNTFYISPLRDSSGSQVAADDGSPLFSCSFSYDQPSYPSGYHYDKVDAFSPYSLSRKVAYGTHYIERFERVRNGRKFFLRSPVSLYNYELVLSYEVVANLLSYYYKNDTMPFYYSIRYYISKLSNEQVSSS